MFLFTTLALAATDCPTASLPAAPPAIADPELDELSGIVESRYAPGVLWVHEDGGNPPALVAIDATGATFSRHDLIGTFEDLEDLAAAGDQLFLADIGDNAYARSEVAVWMLDEPDPFTDGAVAPDAMRLVYPGGPRNAETLLVDPVTLDLYVVTKESGGPASLFVKRAPHVPGGPYVLEALGSPATLDLVATGGDVSEDGSRIIIRDYGQTARLWFRNGSNSLESAFQAEPCAIAIAGEHQGEAIGFLTDGSGVVTVSEGSSQPLHTIGF